MKYPHERGLSNGMICIRHPLIGGNSQSSPQRSLQRALCLDFSAFTRHGQQYHFQDIGSHQ